MQEIYEAQKKELTPKLEKFFGDEKRSKTR